MAVQAVARCAVAVDILENIAAMAGLAAGQSGEEGVVFILMASCKIGVISGMTGDAGSTVPAIDALVWRFQWACALWIDMTGAAAIAALVVDGGNVRVVIGQVGLVMAGGAF